MLLRTFRACSYEVKLLLFCHIVEVCIPQIADVNTQKKQYYQMEVAYNNVFRRFFGYDRFSNASEMFVETRPDNFGFHERLHASENCLVIYQMTSAAWSNYSELCPK